MKSSLYSVIIIPGYIRSCFEIMISDLGGDMMTYFLETVETIESGVGFLQFGSLHLLWLAFFLIITVLNCLWYRKMGVNARNIWKKVVAILLVADEVFKVIMLIIGGRYIAKYLPLHLCSINIFFNCAPCMETL